MTRYMIEDTNEGFAISLMDGAGMHEDTFTIRRCYYVNGSHTSAAVAFRYAEQAWHNARRKDRKGDPLPEGETAE